MCVYVIGIIDTSLFCVFETLCLCDFYFLMLNITPKTTPKNAANNTW